MGGEDVLVDTRRDFRIAVQILQRLRTAGDRLGVLEQDGVAEYEVRSGEPRHLVVREVPRHHAKKQADGALLYVRLVSGEGLDGLVGREPGPALTVVAVDVAAELDFLDGFGERLAHLFGRDAGECVGTLVEQRREPDRTSVVSGK